jgi:hypothetical protein
MDKNGNPILLELFCGTGGVSRSFRERGFRAYGVDWDERFDCEMHADIGALSADDVISLCGGSPDVVWASFDCTTFSIAAIGHHRTRDADTGLLYPKSEYAKACDRIDSHVTDLIRELGPTYWFIENLVGGMRKATFTQGLPRFTTTYCQWEGDAGEKPRMKPTDIWSNHPDLRLHPLPRCHNGDSCHEAAPRGSKTGTQGLKGHVERSRIPKGFTDHIAGICTPLPVVKPPLMMDVTMQDALF